MACLQVARTKATSLKHWKASISFGVFKKSTSSRKKTLINTAQIFRQDWFSIRLLRKQLLWFKNNACKMMTCMFWKRAFVIRFLVVLVMMSVFGGTNALYVIRSDVDAFSNLDAASCSRVSCRRVRGANGCRGGNCRMCQCSRNRPNYLSHRKACVPNDELIGGRDS